MPKKIYIPWFWNSNDDIQKKYIGEDSHVIQKNLRQVDTKKIQEFLEKYGDNAFEKLQKKYPWITKERFNTFVDQIDKFKWWTRDIFTTATITAKEIKDNLLPWERLEIFWHSQWWLVAMMTIINNPELLKYIDNIELLGPVASFFVGRGLHKKDIGHLHAKNIVVREEYIKSWWSDREIMKDFLEVIKDNKFPGKVKLMLWSQDTIVPIKSFDIEKIKKEYPFLDIEIREWDHYLWFKK